MRVGCGPARGKVGVAALGGARLGRDRDRRVPALGGHDAGPVRGEGDYWQRLAALIIVALLVVGHLITWRWEIQGATVMAVAGPCWPWSRRSGSQDWGADAPRARRVHGSRRPLLVDVAPRPAPHAGRGAGRAPHGPGRGQHRRRGDCAADRLWALASPELLDRMPPAPVVWVWSGAPAPTSAVVVARIREPQAEARLAVSTGVRTWPTPSGSQPTRGRPMTPAWRVSTSPGWSPAPGTTTRLRWDGTPRRGAGGASCALPPTGPASFTFAFGNCARIGSNASTFDRIREAGPDSPWSTSVTSPTPTSGPTTAQRCAPCTTRS